MSKLSGQPYLVIQFFQRPKTNIDTRVKGWREDPANLDNMERAFVVDRISSKDSTSPIIINLVNGEVINNAVNKPTDELVAHYIAKYESMIKESLKKWMQQEILDSVGYGRLGK